MEYPKRLPDSILIRSVQQWIAAPVKIRANQGWIGVCLRFGSAWFHHLDVRGLSSAEFLPGVTTRRCQISSNSAAMMRVSNPKSAKPEIR